MSVAVVDADHFKQVNDNYGHRFGDHVLQRVVAEPGSRLRDAVRICEAARHRIDRHPWSELDVQLRLTVSIGVAHGVGPLVAAADVLLAAKNSGRNAVAYRDQRTGKVRLAGPAARRRSIVQVETARPRCDPGRSAT